MPAGSYGHGVCPTCRKTRALDPEGMIRRHRVYGFYRDGAPAGLPGAVPRLVRSPRTGSGSGPLRAKFVRVSDAAFWARVDMTTTPRGCWLWTGPPTAGGYGQVFRGGRNRKAHSIAYELTVGPIPEGLVLDHVAARGCTSRLCVNPAHLEPVTIGENNRRAAALRTACVQGHLFDAMSGSRRVCRRCNAARSRAYKARRRMVAA